MHVTSVYYPNVLVLCIQMEAFILPLLGLHPSNAHLTGIQMFPPTTVSDSVFGALISEVGRSLSALPTRLLALQGKGVCQQGLSDCLEAMSEACRSHDLQYYLLNRSACCRVVVQPGGKAVLFNNCFLIVSEILRNNLHKQKQYYCNVDGLSSSESVCTLCTDRIQNC